MDLPFARVFPVSIEPPTVKNFDPSDSALKIACKRVVESSPSVVDVPGGYEKFSGVFETRYDASNTHIMVESRQNASNTHISILEPYLAVGTYEKSQKFFEGIYGGGGLTLGVGHLVRPPEFVF
jgi:hypothetical protein